MTLEEDTSDKYSISSILFYYNVNAKIVRLLLFRVANRIMSCSGAFFSFCYYTELIPDFFIAESLRSLFFAKQ